MPGLIEAAGQEALFLILDGVTDPHNLGACLRSAEAAGVTAVIVPRDKAVGITPTVRRASAGAADRVPFFAATNLARSLKLLKEAGVWLTGFAGDGQQSLYASDFKGPVGIVIGSEGEGMRRLTREACDFNSNARQRREPQCLGRHRCRAVRGTAPAMQSEYFMNSPGLRTSVCQCVDLPRGVFIAQ